MSLRTLIVVPLVTSAAAAQTYIVDAANGPGTHFRNIPEAVASVPSGAVLRVRPGTYSPFAVANKSLTILGDSNTTVAVGTGVTIGPLAPHEHFELRDVQGFSIAIRNAQGAVHLESLRLGDFDRDSLTVDACANVHLKRITPIDPVNGWCDVTIVGSCVSIDECSLKGRTESVAGFYGHPACHIASSRASVSGSTLRGGNGFMARTFGPTDPGGDGLRVVASTLDLGGGCNLTGGSGAGQFLGLGFWVLLGPGGSGLALTDSTARFFGTVMSGGQGNQGTVAPSIRLQGSSHAIPQLGGGPTARILGTPAIGSTVHFALSAAPNELAILVLGLRPVCVHWPELVGFRDILAAPDVPLGPFLTDVNGEYAHAFRIPTDWVLDRMVWGQYFTFPQAALPALGSNSVTLVVKS